MTTPAAGTSPSLKDTAFGDLQQELATTRRVLERVPEEHFAWKPHDRSWSLAELAQHVATVPSYGTAALRQDEFDLGGNWERPPLPQRREEVLRRFDENAAALAEAFAAADDATFAEPWTLRRGGQIMMTQPKAAVLRVMGINHLVHHRAQLATYLRLLGVSVPSIYGPSADEAPPGWS